MRIALIAIGSSCVFLGLLGIFLPLLPTTPFLLLAAACYAKSSPGLYGWLLNNRWFGKYIKNWREKKGIPLKAKIAAALTIALSIGYAVIFLIDFWPAKIILVLIASSVLVYIFCQPTCKK